MNNGVKCPWGMCDVISPNHHWCGKVFASRLNEFSDEVEKKLHPQGRCIYCGAGEFYWKHKLEYMDREEAHTFVGEFESIDPEHNFDEWLDRWDEWSQKHPINLMDDGSRAYNWRFHHRDGNEWTIEVGY